MTGSNLAQRVTELLAGVELDGYYGPPNETDQRLGMPLHELGTAQDREWQAIVNTLDEKQRHVLGRYSLRAPMLAIQTKSAEPLSTGLLAHVLLRQRVTDWRDDLVAFAPYYHAAQQVGADPVALFDAAANHAVPQLAEVMRRFARRTDVTLEAFGWRQVEHPHGSTLETVDWQGTPTGAVVGDRSWESVNQAIVERILGWARSGKRMPPSDGPES